MTTAPLAGGARRGGAGQTQLQTSESQITATVTRQAVLHLRGAIRENEETDGERDNSRARRRIQWADDVVDNEGLGRKKSKVCCIYHAPKGIDESSDESSSDEDDSESESGDDGAARQARKEGSGQRHNHRDHDHGNTHETGKGKGKRRSPNAYEKVPRVKKGGSKETG